MTLSIGASPIWTPAQLDNVSLAHLQLQVPLSWLKFEVSHKFYDKGGGGGSLRGGSDQRHGHHHDEELGRHSAAYTHVRPRLPRGEFGAWRIMLCARARASTHACAHPSLYRFVLSTYQASRYARSTQCGRWAWSRNWRNTILVAVPRCLLLVLRKNHGRWYGGRDIDWYASFY